jgi:hypothetical protein
MAGRRAIASLTPNTFLNSYSVALVVTYGNQVYTSYTHFHVALESRYAFTTVLILIASCLENNNNLCVFTCVEESPTRCRNSLTFPLPNHLLSSHKFHVARLVLVSSSHHYL